MRERMRVAFTRGLLLMLAVMIGFSLIIWKYTGLKLGLPCLIISILTGAVLVIDIDRTRNGQLTVGDMDELAPDDTKGESKPEPPESESVPAPARFGPEVPPEAGDASKSMALIILIDNYDDLIFGTKEAGRPAVIGQVDTCICDWLEANQAAWRKHERDRFFAIAPVRRLQQMRAECFSVMDRVRAIAVGNQIPPTVSIAIGIAETPGQANTAAREALDVALGRGGDQVVAKQDSKIWFFGGSLRTGGRRMRVKSRLVSQAMRNLMVESTGVTIMSHSMPDFDSFGAALGIAACARFLNKPVRFVYIQAMRSMEPMIEAMEACAEYADFLKPSSTPPQLSETELLVVVDTQRPSFTDYPDLLNGPAKVIVIDHHMRGAESMGNATLSFLEPAASSACELVTELTQYFDDELKIDAFTAEALLAGITLDTKHFAVSTSVRTFEAAAHLRRIATETRAARELFREDYETYVNRAEVVRTAAISEGIAISVCGAEMQNARLIAAQAADLLLTIREIDAAFVLYHQGEGMAVSGRSYGRINAQRVLERIGGGGSRSAAGAQMLKSTPKAALEALRNAIDEEKKEAASRESHSAQRR